MVTIDITDDQGFKTLCLMRHQAKLAGKQLKADLGSDKPITRRQQNSLHLWCEQVANTLEEAGFDMTAVMKKGAKIPWTKYSVKEYLYKPILEAMTGKDSTRDLDTVEPSKVADALSRHLAQRLGVVLPEWPRHG